MYVVIGDCIVIQNSSISLLNGPQKIDALFESDGTTAAATHTDSTQIIECTMPLYHDTDTTGLQSVHHTLLITPVQQRPTLLSPNLYISTALIHDTPMTAQVRPMPTRDGALLLTMEYSLLAVRLRDSYVASKI